MDSMSEKGIADLMSDLKSLGELKVRQLLSEDHWGLPNSILRPHVDDWLRAQEAAREISAQGESAASNREANTLAREAKTSASKANALASRANRNALIALIISATAAIAAIIAAIVAIEK